jgi:branched-chain amino acid transport system substrate-binding protein
LENAVGAIAAVNAKEPSDPQWANDPAMQEYFAFMKQWAPGVSREDQFALHGYITAGLMADLLKRCGDELTRENLLYQATHIKDLQLPLFLPGVKINVTPESRVPWKQARIVRFDGTSWAFVSDVIAAPGED